MRKNFLRTVFCLFLAGFRLALMPVEAQVDMGGKPVSFKFESAQKAAADLRKVESHLDADALMRQENEAMDMGLTPRLAVVVPVDFSLENAGSWDVLPNGTLIWRLGLELEGALGVIVSYSDFTPAPGARLFIYSPDRMQVLGAFTHKSHPQGGSFSTRVIAGSRLVLELEMPEGTRMENLEEALTQTRLHISGLGFCFNMRALRNMKGFSGISGAGYDTESDSQNDTESDAQNDTESDAQNDTESDTKNDTESDTKNDTENDSQNDTKYGESQWCTVNINCADGADWQETKKSVCRMFMRVGSVWYLCTGTLLNNTAQNIRPFIISAHHCLNEVPPSDIDFSQWQFYFDYEAPGCEIEPPLDSKTMVGCVYRASTPLHGGSDGLLLELEQNIPEEWGVLYNGWDRRDRVPADSSAINIHHPAGDIKKISKIEHLTPDSWPVPGAESDSNAHLYCTYARLREGLSITEGGSSGSGVFDDRHRLIATLTGGNASCDLPDGNGFYGRLWYHWNRYGSDSSTQFGYWLDPLGTGAETLDAIYIDPAAPRLDLTRTQLPELRAEDPMSASPADTFYVRASNLNEPVRITAPFAFEVSLDGSDFGTEKQMEGSGTVYVRFNPQAVRRDTSYVILRSTGVEKQVRVIGNSCLPLSLSPEKLAYAYLDQAYTLQLQASGSHAEYSFEILDGKLPRGLELSADGLLSGTPVEYGLFPLSIRVSEPQLCDQVFERALYVSCGVVDRFPYAEGFEEKSMPDCWTQEYINGREDWLFATGLDNLEAPVTAAAEGAFNALFRSESYAGFTTKLISPQMDLSALRMPCLGFSYAQPAWVTDQDELKVYIRSGTLEPWHQLLAFTGDIDVWRDTTVALPEPSAEYFVAFEGISHFGYGVMVDNIRIMESDAPNEPAKIFSTDCPIRFTNPVSEVLCLEWDAAACPYTRFTLCGLTGSVIGTYTAGTGTSRLEIPVGHLPSGVYMLKARSAGAGSTAETTLKVIKK